MCPVPDGLCTCGWHCLGKRLTTVPQRITGHRHTTTASGCRILVAAQQSSQPRPRQREPLLSTLTSRPGHCSFPCSVFTKPAKPGSLWHHPALASSFCVHLTTKLGGKADCSLCWLKERAGVTASELLVPQLCAVSHSSDYMGKRLFLSWCPKLPQESCFTLYHFLALWIFWVTSLAAFEQESCLRLLSVGSLCMCLHTQIKRHL